MAWFKPLTKSHQVRRANKFNAKRVEVQGVSFSSQGEAEMHALLKLMERGKLISNIRLQQSIQLTPSVNWKVDFVVFDEQLKADVAIEFKGFETERFRLICQLLNDFAPMPVRIYKKTGNRISLWKEYPKALLLTEPNT